MTSVRTRLPQQVCGKVHHLKIIVFLPFCLGFFRLVENALFETHRGYAVNAPQQLRHGNAAKTKFVFGGSRLYFKYSLVVFSAIGFEYIVVRNYGCEHTCKNIQVVVLSVCRADPLYFGLVQSPRVRAF